MQTVALVQQVSFAAQVIIERKAGRQSQIHDLYDSWLVFQASGTSLQVPSINYRPVDGTTNEFRSDKSAGDVQLAGNVHQLHCILCPYVPLPLFRRLTPVYFSSSPLSCSLQHNKLGPSPSPALINHRGLSFPSPAAKRATTCLLSLELCFLRAVIT